MKAMAYEALNVRVRLGLYLNPTVGLVDVNVLRVGCGTSVELRMGGVRPGNDVIIPLFEVCRKSSRRMAACSSREFAPGTRCFPARIGLFACAPAACAVCL